MKSELENLFEQESISRNKLYEFLEENSHLSLYNNLDMYWCVVSHTLYMNENPFTKEIIESEGYHSVEVVGESRKVKGFTCIPCNIRQFTDDHIEVLDDEKQCTDESVIQFIKNW